MPAAALNTDLALYLAAWALACLIALWRVAARPREFSFLSGPYVRFLCRPWKLTTFALAATGLVVVAPYTGDPTWDYFDASFMAAATFATAPWVIGIFYRAARRRASGAQIFVAVCMWMFSASWSYDLYQLARTGQYPDTWFANIFASSVLYFSAGLLWNLDWKPGIGTTFAFFDPDWPAARVDADRAGFRRIAWFALPFMILAASCVGYFLLPAGWLRG